MTRAQGPDDEIEYAGSGIPGADRTVVVLRTGAMATVDPDASVTHARRVHVLLVHVEGPDLDDPPAFGGETPAGSTASALARIARKESPDAVLSLVAVRETCAIAISLVAQEGLPVESLALVAPVVPEEPLQRDLAIGLLGRIDAPTLIVAAETEPATVEAAAWFAPQLANGSTAVLPASLVDSPDGLLGLRDAWETVLVHVARSRG